MVVNANKLVSDFLRTLPILQYGGEEMLKLLMDYWYRSIAIIDDKGLFNIIFSFVYIIAIVLITFINFLFLSSNNLIAIVVLGILLIQYNIPSIIVEIQQYKNVHYLVNKLALCRYVTFQLMKKNVLLSLFIISHIFLCIFFMTDIQKIIVIILNIFIQGNLMLLKMFNKKYKISIVAFLVCYTCVYTLFTNKLLLIPILVVNVGVVYRIIYLQLKYYILNNNTYKENSSYTEEVNSVTSLKLYFKRLSTKEYAEFIILYIGTILIYQYFGSSYAEYFILVLFIAQLELSIDAKNVNFDKSYGKYIFTKLANVPQKLLMINTIEFRLGVMYTFNALIILIVDIINSQLNIYRISSIINMICLIWFFIIKYLSAYYNYLGYRMKLKSTGFKVTMLYIMIIFLAPDLFRNVLIKNLNYNDIYGEAFKCIIIVLLFVFRFENIFLKLSKVEK